MKAFVICAALAAAAHAAPCAKAGNGLWTTMNAGLAKARWHAKYAALAADRCVADRWSSDATDCFATRPSDRCFRFLTIAQKQKLRDAIAQQDRADARLSILVR